MCITNEVTCFITNQSVGEELLSPMLWICLSPTKVPVDLSVAFFVTNLKAQSENPVLGPPNPMVMNFLWGIWSYYAAGK